MTVQKDVQRAGLRAMMAESMLGVPEYSADPKVLSRVGNVIGETASHEERHVRASDSLPRSTHAAHAAARRHAAAAPAFFFGTSATMASVVISSAATDAAFWIAARPPWSGR
jgi:hypothetical protein